MRAAWISLCGELDLATAPLLGNALREALTSARIIVLDLRELTFIDCAGVRLILEAEAKARRQGHGLTFVRGPAQVNRLFDLLGLSDQLRIVDLDAGVARASALHNMARGDAA